MGKIRKTISSVLSLVLILSALVVGGLSSFAATTPVIYAESVNAIAGNTVEIPICIKNNSGLLGWNLIFNYDSDILKPVSISNATDWTGTLSDTITGSYSKDGEFEAVYQQGTITDNISNGVIMYVTFEIDEAATGSTEISISFNQENTYNCDFEDVELVCENIQVNISNSSTVIKFDSQEITAGESVDIPLSIINSNSLSDIDITLNYDNENFEYIQFESEESLDINVSESNGTIKISISGISSDIYEAVVLQFKSDDFAYDKEYEFLAEYNNAVGTDDIVIKNPNINVKASATSNAAVISSDTDLKGNYGETISVPFYISHNKGLFSYGLILSYDNEYLEPISIETASDFGGQIIDNIGRYSDHINIMWNTVDETDKNGIFMIAKFEIISEINDVNTVISVDYSQDDTSNFAGDDVILICNDVNILLNHIPVVTSLELKSLPDKTTYELYEEFDLSGMVVEAVKDDGTSEEITDYIVVGFDSDSVGTKTVTLIYEEQSVSFDIEISHTHKWGEWETVLSPNCIDEGYEQRICEICEEIETRDIDALGHEWESSYTVDIEPTCETSGSKSIHCENCEATKNITEISALGHDYDDTITKTATCTENGVKTYICKNDASHTYTEEIPMLGHNYVSTITKEPTCEENGLITYVCLNDSSHIKEETIKATGHTYSDWIIDKEPTYFEDGSKHKECTVCKEVLETESISMLEDNSAPEIEININEHSFKSFVNNITFELFFKSNVDVIIMANDDESGIAKIEYIKTAVTISETDIANQTEWIEGDKLTVDDDGEFIIYVKATDNQGNVSYAGTDGLVVDKTVPVISGITDSAVYCDSVSFTVSDKYFDKVTINGETAVANDGEYTLTPNDKEYTIVALDKAGNETVYTVTVNEDHTYDEWIIDTPADCTEQGEKHRICSVCGHEETKIIKALGHDYEEEFTVDKEATCTEKGEKSRHCSRCDTKTDVTVINALGHSFGEWETIVSPDCTNSGSRQRICSVCGFTETEELNSNGHSWSKDYTVDVPATCTIDGSKSIHCKNCDAVKESQVISATGHSFGEYTVAEPATCTDTGIEKRICSACGEEDTKIISALGHSWDTDYTVDVEPGCLTEGSKSIHCANCDATKDAVVITAVGHKGGVANCHSGAVCDVCGEEYGDPDLSNHDGDIVVIGYITPTTDDFGYTGDTYCGSCGIKLADGEQIDKLLSETTQTTISDSSSEEQTDNAESTTQKSKDTTTDASNNANKDTSKISPATGNKVMLPIIICIAFAFILIYAIKKIQED